MAKKSTWIAASNLDSGDYAITKADGMAVMAVSKASFKPCGYSLAQIVNLENGVGAFPARELVRRCSSKEAFALVLANQEKDA